MLAGPCPPPGIVVGGVAGLLVGGTAGLLVGGVAGRLVGGAHGLLVGGVAGLLVGFGPGGGIVGGIFGPAAIAAPAAIAIEAAIDNITRVRRMFVLPIRGLLACCDRTRVPRIAPLLRQPAASRRACR